MELAIDMLTKQYKNKIAVDKVSIKLKPGVYGLLGANGAGKTTLLRMISGIMTPSSGTITIDNLNYKDNELEIKKRISFLTGNTKLYKDLSTRGGLQTSSWLFTTRFWILSRFYSL